MSNLAIITLPFLNSLLNKEDYSKDAGFVDLYTNDIDHPTYENELYLLYDDIYINLFHCIDGPIKRYHHLLEMSDIIAREFHPIAVF